MILRHRAVREVPRTIVRSTKSIKSQASIVKNPARKGIVLDHAKELINLIEGRLSQRVRCEVLNRDQGIHVHGLVVVIVTDVGIKKMNKSFPNF